MSESRARSRLAFALDYPSLASAREGVQRAGEHVGVLKVGLELFLREGPAAVALGAEHQREVFLDLKLHDIPETVARAVGSAVELGVRFLTLHAAGGPRMLQQAVRQAEGTGLTLLAVTVLTSLDASDLERTGVGGGVEQHARRLGRLAWDCGVGGLVCSVAEVEQLRAALGPEAVLVTPGIRPSGGETSDDQKRTGTPASAIRSGASLLVVGRPIRDALDPAAAARGIVREIAEAMGG